jgi:hypothetical protein
VLLAAGGGLGALLAFFLDPARGKGRRATARDRVGGLARRTLRRGRRQLRHVASDAAGTVERVARHKPARKKLNDLDDAALAAKVETELFGKGHVPKGAINLDAQNGVIVLRGEIEARDQAGIEESVRRIPGVRDVRNLLHSPGTPAPNKAAALRASSRALTDAPTERAGPALESHTHDEGHG